MMTETDWSAGSIRNTKDYQQPPETRKRQFLSLSFPWEHDTADNLDFSLLVSGTVRVEMSIG
jgi:hypothetical protein